MTPPDSGEREVRCDATWTRRCIKPRDHHGPHDHRPVEEQGAALVPLPLAQRMLAALEEQAAFLRDGNDGLRAHPLTALASELRAAVERKP